jgi:hypothetical protein
MKYLITESQINKVIFKYLDNQDFVYMEYGINGYFLNSEKDEYAQIKLNSHRCTIDRKLMTEIASFFSLDNFDSLSSIAKWVESKTGTHYITVGVESDIIVYYFKK